LPPRTRLRLAVRLLGAAALALVVLAPAAAASDLSPATPHSPNAEDGRDVYWIAVVLGVLLIGAVNAALIGAVVRFRASRGRQPVPLRRRRRPQLWAGLVGGGIAAFAFIVGVVFTERSRDVEPAGADGLQAAAARTAQLDLRVPEEATPLRINATAQQWLWRFTYPGEDFENFSYYELVVPVDTPVLLQVGSTDVVHSFWVPELVGQVDAVPGQRNFAWFKADREGTYDGQSAVFSGAAYATMRVRVRVVSVIEYEAWLDAQRRGIQEGQAAVQSALSRTGAPPGTQPGEQGQ
jgi:cytochrome c oxidase subunit 2